MRLWFDVQQQLRRNIEEENHKKAFEKAGGELGRQPGTGKSPDNDPRRNLAHGLPGVVADVDAHRGALDASLQAIDLSLDARRATIEVDRLTGAGA